MSFELRGTDEQAEKLVEQPLAAVAAAQAAHPDVRVEQFGEVSATKAIAAQDAKDGKQSQLISNVLMLIILLVAFGAVVAAGLPLVLGASAVAAAVGLIGPVSQLYALPADVAELMVIIGLAVGVDYAMFYSRRVMEERDRGRSVEDAVEVAAATSGRAVLISGLTVMTAMAGLLFAGNPIFVGFGIGTMLVVAVAVLGSLTFLPAMLAFLSRKNWLEKGRVPFITKRRHANQGQSRVWNAILTRVLKRPLRVDGDRRRPARRPQRSPRSASSSRTRASTATRAASRSSRPTTGSRPPSPAAPSRPRPSSRPTTSRPRPVQAAIEQLHDRALATGAALRALARRDQPRQDRRRRRALGQGQRHRRRLRALARGAALRGRARPPSAGCAGAEVAVTGVTAGSKDFIDAMAVARAARARASCSASRSSCCWSRSARSSCRSRRSSSTCCRSAPPSASSMLVFQDGHGAKLLDFQSVGGIAPVIPLFLFVILFGLSMDYHVFILSRVREAVNRGMSNDDAVAHGIKSTAGVVTSAALVMVAVFGSFAIASDQLAKQIGVGLAVAILIDATIIRAVLLPATMKLLGERNWYLPKRLGWLPKLEHATA